MRITIFTSISSLLLASTISLAFIAPKIQELEILNTVPGGIVAGVSLGANVEATPTNTLYAQLQEQKKNLDQKEQDLKAKESYLNRYNGRGSLIIIYTAMVLLFILVLVNFGFDIWRYRKNRPTPNPL